MHFLVFDRAPQPFDENIVHETTASVHRNRDACSLEPAGEGGAGELRALIGVEYFRREFFVGVLQCSAFDPPVSTNRASNCHIGASDHVFCCNSR